MTIDTSRCHFDGPREVGYMVEKINHEANLTVPFLAQNKEHAEQWVNQWFAVGKYKVTEVTLRHCHCGKMKVFGQAGKRLREAKSENHDGR